MEHSADYDALAEVERRVTEEAFYIPSQYEEDALVYRDTVLRIIAEERAREPASNRPVCPRRSS